MHYIEIIPAAVRALIDWFAFLFDVFAQYFGFKDDIYGTDGE